MNLSHPQSQYLSPESRFGEVEHLLDGLERQKEELGPIAAELIDMLRRLGVDLQTPPGAVFRTFGE